MTTSTAPCAAGPDSKQAVPPTRRSRTRVTRPGGVALLVECLTDNRNRATSEVRVALTRNGRIDGRRGIGVVSVQPQRRRDRAEERDARRGRCAGGRAGRRAPRRSTISASPTRWSARRRIWCRCGRALVDAGIDYESAETPFLAVGRDSRSMRRPQRKSSSSSMCWKSLTRSRTSTRLLRDRSWRLHRDYGLRRLTVGASHDWRRVPAPTSSDSFQHIDELRLLCGLSSSGISTTAERRLGRTRSRCRRRPAPSHRHQIRRLADHLVGLARSLTPRRRPSSTATSTSSSPSVSLFGTITTPLRLNRLRHDPASAIDPPLRVNATRTSDVARFPVIGQALNSSATPPGA